MKRAQKRSRRSGWRRCGTTWPTPTPARPGARLAAGGRPRRERAVPAKTPAAGRGGPARIAKLLAALDGDDFEGREKASRGLAELGDLAGPAVRQALAGKPSPEARRRLEQLARGLDKPVEDAEEARALRGVEVLEHIGSADARKLLEELSHGAEGGAADAGGEGGAGPAVEAGGRKAMTRLKCAAALGAVVCWTAAAADTAPRTDAHGDPLPPDALLRLGTVRWRACARFLAFTPDGKTLVTGEYPPASVIRCWDVATGKETGSFAVDGGLFAVALAPDGKTLAVSESQGIVFRSVPDGKLVRRLQPADAAPAGAGPGAGAASSSCAWISRRTARLWPRRPTTARYTSSRRRRAKRSCGCRASSDASFRRRSPPTVRRLPSSARKTDFASWKSRPGRNCSSRPRRTTARR